MTTPAKSETDDTEVAACTFLRSCIVVVVAMMVVSACDLPPPEGAVEVPCDGDVGTILELGFVSELGANYAQFGTSGGTVWVTVDRIDTGPIFETDQTRVDVGWASEPPGRNEASVLTQVTVKQGHWSPLELEPGDYWLWSSNGGDVTIQACTADVIFDAFPATFPPDPAG